MNDNQPLVSIIIPVYNGSNYLKKAIDSALNQTYSNIEILVINDGSTDNGHTEQIAVSYGASVQYIHQPNGGVASALNRGIKEMNGKYMSWLSHDDVYYSKKIEKQIEYFRSYKFQNCILYSNYDFIDKDSRFIRKSNIPYIKPNNFICDLILGYPIHGCTALVPKAVFDRIGYFDETLRTTQDYDIWYRMAKRFDFIFIEDELIQSRLHEEQGTVVLSELAVKECNELLINFIKDINPKIITNFDKYNNILSFYWEAYKSFKERNFNKAAAYTAQQFKKSIVTKDVTLNPPLWLFYFKHVRLLK